MSNISTFVELCRLIRHDDFDLNEDSSSPVIRFGLLMLLSHMQAIPELFNTCAVIIPTKTDSEPETIDRDRFFFLEDGSEREILSLAPTSNRIVGLARENSSEIFILLSIKSKVIHANLTGSMVKKFIRQIDLIENARVIAYVSNTSRLSHKTGSALNEINALPMDDVDITSGLMVFNCQYRNSDFGELVQIPTPPTIVYTNYQIYTIYQTKSKLVEAFNESSAYNIVWGHVARSGKTYMINGLIEELFDSIEDTDLECIRVLIIAMAPKETISQYMKVMSGLKTRMPIITDKTKIDSVPETQSVVFIFSKQMLTHSVNADLDIPNVSLIISDEVHWGGMTSKSKNFIDQYDIPKVFVTATYTQVLEDYQVDLLCKWDLEDIRMERRREYDVLEYKYSGFTKSIEYANACLKSSDAQSRDLVYPKMNIVSIATENNLPIVSKFKLVNQEFEDDEFIFDTLEAILVSTISNIDDLNARIGQRPVYNENDPSVIMMFVSSAHVVAMTDYITEFVDANESDIPVEVCPCNTVSAEVSNIHQTINKSLNAAKKNGKKAVLAISGKQGHLGITIPKCDVVIMFHTSTSRTYCFQSMFRCMTEALAKKNGYIIDVSMERSLTFIRDYATQCLSPIEIIDGNNDNDERLHLKSDNHTTETIEMETNAESFERVLGRGVIGWTPHNQFDLELKPCKMSALATETFDLVTKAEEVKLAVDLGAMRISDSDMEE